RWTESERFTFEPNEPAALNSALQETSRSFVYPRARGPASRVPDQDNRAFAFRNATFAFETDGKCFHLGGGLGRLEADTCRSVRVQMDQAGADRILLLGVDRPKLVVAPLSR